MKKWIHLALMGIGIMVVLSGCREEMGARAAMTPPPDCNWSERCVKRIVKTTHFDESTAMVDVTYYDKKERLIRDIRDYGTEYSSGGIEYEYNEAGDLVTERFVDKDGATESILRYDYDSQHRVIRRVGHYYRPYGHENNSTVTYEYNDTEHTMVKRTDHDTDGKYEVIEYYWFDASGRRIKTEIDADGDGEIEMVWRYDPHGREVEYRADRDNDGKMEITMRSQSEYDAQGRVIVSRHDTNNDGVFEDTVTYTYNAQGRVASVTTRLEKTTYSYDEHNRLIEVKEQTHDGSVRIEKARYDDANNTLEIVSDYNGNGTMDDRIWCHWAIDYYDDAPHEKESYLAEKTWRGGGCYVWSVDKDPGSDEQVIPGNK